MADVVYIHLLPPHRGLSVARRLELAIEAREQLLRWGYKLAAYPDHDRLYVVSRRGGELPADVAALVGRHRLAFMALILRPDACEAVLERSRRSQEAAS